MPTPTHDLPQHLHDKLLRAFLDPARDLMEIADSLGLSITQLIEWTRSDRTREQLAAIQEIAHQRAAVLAALGLPAAVDGLVRAADALATQQPEPEAPMPVRLRFTESVRRNATSLQRLARPASPLRAAAISAPAASLADTPCEGDPAIFTNPIHARDRPAAAA